MTTIFSHLAALLAVEQADELATHSPREKIKAEREAVRRAEEMESCQLMWDCERGMYVLLHPSSQQQEQPQRMPALIGAAGIPLSPSPSITRSSPGTGTLHITVSTPSTDNDTESKSPLILITAPTPTTSRQNTTSTPPTSLLATPTPRTSTLPLTDTDTSIDFHSPLAIASLDLSTMTLGINAAKIIEAVPSLYAVDVVVATVLAVGVVDARTNSVVMGVDVDVTSERELGGGGGGVSRLDERDDAQGGEIIEQVRSAIDTSTSTNTKQSHATTTINAMKTSLSNFGTWTRSLPTKLNLHLRKPNPTKLNPHPPNPDLSKPLPNAPQPRTRNKPKNKQIVLEEFDLEHYGRHGPDSSPEREKLPGVTRGILRVLFCGLEMVVRGLTVAVKLIAWVVVRVSGWVGRRF